MTLNLTEYGLSPCHSQSQFFGMKTPTKAGVEPEEEILRFVALDLAKFRGQQLVLEGSTVGSRGVNRWF
ncbi:hypothetical protein CBR_g41422 [Chara braunii]|uniref:Uncharacterized protein n=1 Tax=Chara braunii TaxID=69332 RepID=A0A388LVZ0_CHABU|nr:hypothetical protein CBR_g41422 [Chara braunii]|eukprot:GBG86425.1 hypothetical protein CBR_g41422 [Chara braunii]